MNLFYWRTGMSQGGKIFVLIVRRDTRVWYPFFDVLLTPFWFKSPDTGEEEEEEETVGVYEDDDEDVDDIFVWPI